MATYYYSGQGRVYYATRDVSGLPEGFEELGNVPSLEVSVETTKFEHKESMSGSRAVDVTVVQEKKGTFTMTVEDVSMATLAMAFWGSHSTVAAGTSVVNNNVIAHLDKRCPLGYPKVSNVVVKDVTDVTTYVEDTDYTVDLAYGIIVPLSTGAITQGDILHVTFDHAAYGKMEAFQATSQQRYLRFEGLNTLDNKEVIVDIFKADLDPLTGYGLINEELSSFELSGSILYDDLQSGNSKFFTQVNVS